jgi:hypothetical protein
MALTPPFRSDSAAEVQELVERHSRGTSRAEAVGNFQKGYRAAEDLGMERLSAIVEGCLALHLTAAVVVRGP